MKGKSVLEVLTVFLGLRLIFIPILSGNPIIEW